MSFCNNSKRILVILLISLVVIITTGCGEAEKDKKTIVSAESEELKNSPVEAIANETTDEDIDTGDSYQEEITDGNDLGEPCREHEYIVAAGSSTSLDFQIIMKREVMMIDSDKNKLFDPEDISIRDSSDYWTDLKVERDKPSIYVDTIDTSVDRWTVDTEAMQGEYENKPGKLTRISQTLGNKTKYTIKLTERNFGIIERLGYRNSEKKVAEMTDNEVYDALGGIMEIKYTDSRIGTFTLPVEIQSIDTENYILNVSYDISFPESLPAATTGTRLWQEVRIGDSVDIRFVLRFDYDKKRGLFHVFGPWFEASCF